MNITKNWGFYNVMSVGIIVLNMNKFHQIGEEKFLSSLPLIDNVKLLLPMW